LTKTVDHVTKLIQYSLDTKDGTGQNWPK